MRSEVLAVVLVLVIVAAMGFAVWWCRQSEWQTRNVSRYVPAQQPLPAPLYAPAPQPSSAPAPAPQPLSPTQQPAGYVRASGRIWIGVKIYAGGGNSYGYVGTVTAIDNQHYDPISGQVFDGVEIEGPNGVREWKERSALRSWGYVRNDDPALQ